MDADTKRMISRFLADFALVAEFAEAHPDQANDAWTQFRNDYGLTPEQLRELRLNAVRLRLDPTQEPS